MSWRNGHVEQMAYTGKKPWHGFGVQVEGEAMTSLQAMQLGLPDYGGGVSKIPYINPISGEPEDDLFAVCRNDDQKFLGRVGRDYKVLNAHQMFSFMDGLVESGKVGYHTVGSLHDGKHIWMAAKVLEDPYEVVPGDILERFILLSTSFDGSEGTRFAVTPIRPECWNMLNWAFRGAERNEKQRFFSIRHTENQIEQLEQAKVTMGIAMQSFDEFAQIASVLAKKPLTDIALDQFVEIVLPASPSKEDPTQPAKVSTQLKNKRERIKKLTSAGMGQQHPNVRGTAWAALNGATEYFNYLDGRNTSRRLQNLWYGRNADRIDNGIKFLLNYDVNETRTQYQSVSVVTQPLQSVGPRDVGSRFSGLEMD